MGIVAAGVHHAVILGAVRRLIQLLNGQRVDVRTDAQDFTGFCSLDNCNHTGGRRSQIRNPHLFQLGYDVMGGLMLLIAKFRMFMKPTAGFYGVAIDRLSQCINLICVHKRRFPPFLRRGRSPSACRSEP